MGMAQTIRTLCSTDTQYRTYVRSILHQEGGVSMGLFEEWGKKLDGLVGDVKKNPLKTVARVAIVGPLAVMAGVTGGIAQAMDNGFSKAEAEAEAKRAIEAEVRKRMEANMAMSGENRIGM